MKKYTNLITLILIVLFSLCIRIYHLNLDTPTIYGDEAGHYQYLQKLLSPTGQSKWLFDGVFFTSNSLTWLFGLSPLGVRLPSALYGTVFVVIMYIFSLAISKNNKLALVTATLTAVSPYSYILSRIGHTSVQLLLVFFVLSCHHLASKNTISNNILGFTWLSLAFFIYPSMLIIAPFSIAYLLFRIFKSNNHHNKLLLMVFSALFLSLAVHLVGRFHLFNPAGRALSLAIWRDVNVTAENNLYRGIAEESSLTKLFYNYPMSVAGAFVKNYLSFFSPDFLFLKGDPVLRHSTGQVGAFLPFSLPFMLYGAFRFFAEEKPKLKKLFIVWILVSPIPAAITSDGAGYLLRAVTLMPFLTYFIALGVTKSFDLIRKRYVKTIYFLSLLCIAIYSAGSFLYGYFTVYPTLSARSFEYGFKDLSQFQQTNGSAPMLVIWRGYHPDMVFRFWQKTPFDQYIAFVPKIFSIGESNFKQTYSNLYLGWPNTPADLSNLLTQIEVKYLAVPSTYQLPGCGKLVKTIYYPDKTKAFDIYQINP